MKRLGFAVLPMASMVLTLGLMAAQNAPADTRLLWGDTHLHTSYSLDAYQTGNINADPDTAYRFAKGMPVLHPGLRTRVRIVRPLDFLVVSDHAEQLGQLAEAAKGNPLITSTEWGKALQASLQQNPQRGMRGLTQPQQQAANQAFRSNELRQGLWAHQVDAAEKHNDPGKFTAFAGWEWTVHPGTPAHNLHRVVFTSAPVNVAKKFLPFTANDSQRPEDLWQFMEKTKDMFGADLLAIPHNSNISGGLMFDLVDSTGRPISAEYARSRIRWEPVMEATQMKGTSETAPELSPNDEFADFEIRRKYLAGQPTTPGKSDYARTALMRGLEIEEKVGVNPYKFGMIGSGDSHTGLSSSEENDFLGKLVNDSLPEVRKNIAVIFPAWEMSTGGMAGVWATANTREAIMAAFKRKEVYATTGPRIAVRVFGGFSFAAADANEKDIAAVGYKKGIPMGGDLTNPPNGKAPTLLIHAVKDPISGNLDRIQVVKGWLDASGTAREKVFDVVWSGDRKKDASGKLPPVGNTVNTKMPSYTNTIGAAQLATVWTDPEFNANQRAFYYVRVLEIPTPRHSVFDAVALGIDVADTKQPATIQERAYSSPIWYTPPAARR